MQFLKEYKDSIQLNAHKSRQAKVSTKLKEAKTSPQLPPMVEIGKNRKIGRSALKIMVQNAVSQFMTRGLPKSIDSDAIINLDPSVASFILDVVIKEFEARKEHIDRG